MLLFQGAADALIRFWLEPMLLPAKMSLSCQHVGFQDQRKDHHMPLVQVQALMISGTDLSGS